MKKVYIINGYPESGKSSFSRHFEKILKIKYRNKNPWRIYRGSVINPIKRIAKTIGWDGNKDACGRKFLSDLKDALDSYTDFTFKTIDNLVTRGDIVFIDARSPKDIDYAVKKYNATTIFISRTGKSAMVSDEELQNHADMNVTNYTYDYYIKNDGTKKDYKSTIEDFVENAFTLS